MSAKTIACLTLILIAVLTTQKIFAADYAVAAPSFTDGKCFVVIWIHEKGESKRIIYTGNYADKLCHVEIPTQQFEKHFSYCTLAGINVDGSNNYLAQFGGGAGGDREIYWFEWRDAQKVFPTFNCVLRRQNKAN